jgi:two-component system, NtrC family, nitrogen regulation sensor histidine kinase NtrY
LTEDSYQTRTIREEGAPRRVSGLVGGLAVVLALISAILTFLVLSGSTPITPVHQIVISLFILNGILIFVLIGVVAYEAIGIIKAQRAGVAAAGLHVRVVALFSIIGALPAILSAVIATVTIERGLEPWFSDRMRDVIFRSVDVANAYTSSQCRSLGREIRLLGDDLVRAKPAFDADRAWFEGFLTSRASLLGLPVAQLMTDPETILSRAKIDVIVDPPKPDPGSFEDAKQSSDPICGLPASGRIFSAILKLPSYTDTYLFVAREVDQLAVDFPAQSRAAAVEYLSIDARRKGVQVAFASMYALIALILLLSAVWLGLNFANRLVAPIRRMIHATDQVSSGNFYVQVPVKRSEGDLAHLGATFNKMTSDLRRQRDGLVSASELIDRRRRFTEAVLSGVSSGVVGLDSAGRVTLINRSAEGLLAPRDKSSKDDLLGNQLGKIVPELQNLIEDALSGRARLVSGQVSLSREGREHLLNVRVAREGEQVGQGFVVTLDDISDLVSAQRTAAWADVARRIAHEIKNPLTPIQLSAERIQRRFGKTITEGRDVFDQCTQTIIRQVEDIRRMVDEFSSFARMPKAQAELDDIAETVRQAGFLMRVGYPGIAISEQVPDGTVMAMFDRRLISQALTNVIKNSCEAISVSGQVASGSVVATLTRDDSGIIRIDVVDTGKGWPVEGRQKLLEPYMTTREGGTGLGLPIVAKIFEDHGGGIELLDRVDGKQGAMLRLWFPAKGPDLAATDEHSTIQTPKMTGART